MLDLAAIGIKNAVTKIGLWVQWGVDQQNLVTTHPKLPVRKRTSPLWRHVNGLPNPVEHNKVVARPVHFGEIPYHFAIIPYSPHQGVGDSPQLAKLA
jgi:hypothetical protein